MGKQSFPVIDLKATGLNLARLWGEKGLTVRDVQAFFGFEHPQAVYKWQRGQSLPSVDNLYALSVLLGVHMDEIIVSSSDKTYITSEQQEKTCCSDHLYAYSIAFRRICHLTCG